MRRTTRMTAGIARRAAATMFLLLAFGACAPVRTPGIEQIDAGTAPQSVKPGINDPYLEPDLDPEEWEQRFEVETREIYHAREQIVRAVGLRPGMRVADVGAGTGLFVEPFAREVGPAGTVYALDIAPAFVEHIAQRAADLSLAQVKARLCEQDSIGLPPGSIDLAFICDVYHHFEFPHSSMASIHSALRPNGEVVVIDFERIPGVSREWVLGHVRAGKEEFIREIEEAGFRYVGETTIPRFEESYFVRFRRVER